MIILFEPVVIFPFVKVRRPFTVASPDGRATPLELLILRFPYVKALRVWAAAPTYSTVRLVNVLLVMVYCELKSAVAAVLVTCTVPLPVSVPAPLTMTAAAGEKTALALTVRVPTTLKFVFAETGAPVFVMVKLLNAVSDDPPIVCDAEPLKVTVLPVAVKVPLFEKLPFMS